MCMGQFDIVPEIIILIEHENSDYRNIFEPVGLKLIFDPACFDPTLEQRSNFESSILGGTASFNPSLRENEISCVLSFIVF